jgi:glycosyltransferase involved in cell wall biosynthesis
MHSGIATMAREFVVKSAHRYNWFNLGGAISHPEKGKILDLSEDLNKLIGIEDSDVKVQPNNGYGDAMTIRSLIKTTKPDAIFIFTDPRYWTWLFDIEREIRSKIPIFWLNIWDDYPAPMYNKNYYDSVDVLMAISKQTKNINKLVLGEKASSKLIKYVPHGIDDSIFTPVDKTAKEFIEFKEALFNGKDIEFTVFFNSRNIHRKRPGDIILAYKHFCDLIGKEKAKKCALVLHTQPSDNNGTDLKAVKSALCDPEYVNIYFSVDKLNSQQMNLLYNVADATMMLSSNEGWGLALTESMMAGTMIISNVTGGMQDQMRFVDDKGKWIDFDADFPSNHRGTYKECGEWAVPIFPSNISLAGSPATPYIFDDRCQPEDAAEAIKKVYELSKEERTKRGLAGREWAQSDEAQMSSTKMTENIMKTMEEGFENFTPRPKYEIHKIGPIQKNRVVHKLTGY